MAQAPILDQSWQSVCIPSYPAQNFVPQNQPPPNPASGVVPPNPPPFGAERSMGDLMSPKRRDVFDRLRRRIELYRRHQSQQNNRAEPYLHRFWDQQRQDTNVLHQRWQESKNKRSSKASKRTSSESISAQSQAANNPQGSGSTVSATSGTTPGPHNQIAVSIRASKNALAEGKWFNIRAGPLPSLSPFR